jgi:hypothetical protein
VRLCKNWSVVFPRGFVSSTNIIGNDDNRPPRYKKDWNIVESGIEHLPNTVTEHLHQADNYDIDNTYVSVYICKKLI